MKSFFRFAFIAALIAVAVGMQAFSLFFGGIIEKGITSAFGWLSLLIAFGAGSASALASKENP